MQVGTTEMKLSEISLFVAFCIAQAPFAPAFGTSVTELRARGDSLRAAGQFEAAAEAYRDAYSEDESNNDVLRALADVSIKLGDLGAAMQAYQLIIDNEKNDVDAYLELARIGWLTGDMETALKYVEFAEIVSVRPNEKIPAYRAIILRGKGELVAAESVLVAACSEFPNSALIESNLGLVRALTKGPEVGFEHLKRAYEIDSLDVYVLSSLGSLYFAAGQLDSASMYFDRALTLEPDNYILKRNMEEFTRLTDQTSIHKLMSEGVRYFDNALYTKARKAFSDVIALDSNFFEAYLNLGFTHNLLGEPRKAVVVFKRASELEDSSAPLYIGWGNALAVIGELDSAIEKYRVAISIDSTVPEVQNAMEAVIRLKAEKARLDSEKAEE